jgi:hypothetical protein
MVCSIQYTMVWQGAVSGGLTGCRCQWRTAGCAGPGCAAPALGPGPPAGRGQFGPGGRGIQRSAANCHVSQKDLSSGSHSPLPVREPL